MINIEGHDLSLRDIREKIVFTHWKDPKTIYGFFYGDLGSPSLQKSAFNSANLSELLQFSAEEFTNSLRSISQRGETIFISHLYLEAAPYYFPNFQMDIRPHLRTYLRDDVAVILDKGRQIKIDKYVTDVADISGGLGKQLSSGSSTVQRFDENGLTTRGFIQDEFFAELIEKREELRRQGLLRRGTVIIEDIETESLSVEEIE